MNELPQTEINPASLPGRFNAEQGPPRAAAPVRIPPAPGLLRRLVMAFRWLFGGILPSWGRLPDGRAVAFADGKVMVEGDLEIVCTGSLVVRAQKHVFLESGTGTTPEGRPWIVSINGPRDGYVPIASRDGRTFERWDA